MAGEREVMRGLGIVEIPYLSFVIKFGGSIKIVIIYLLILYAVSPIENSAIISKLHSY